MQVFIHLAKLITLIDWIGNSITIVYVKYVAKMLCMVRLRNKNVPRPDRSDVVPAQKSTITCSGAISTHNFTSILNTYHMQLHTHTSVWNTGCICHSYTDNRISVSSIKAWTVKSVQLQDTLTEVTGSNNNYVEHKGQHSLETWVFCRRDLWLQHACQDHHLLACICACLCQTPPLCTYLQHSMSWVICDTTALVYSIYAIY